MKTLPKILSTVGKVHGLFAAFIRFMAFALLGLAGVGILTMMTVTCLDGILRVFGRPLPGALDIVKLCSAVTIACALPYTTAVKGHVAIEYFFLKLSKRGRVIVDTLARITSIALFVFLAKKSFEHGLSMARSGQVTSTLQIPVFWVPQVIGFCCAITALVIVHNLLHPGREMIRP